jgi:hypothetical protein
MKQGFNERLVMSSRPAIGVMFKQVSVLSPFICPHREPHFMYLILGITLGVEDA